MRIAVVMVVVAVWVVGAIWLPARARAQSGTDVSRAIPVHPDVATVLQLPDEITDVWSIGGDEVMVKGVGAELYLRPRPATPAGVEVFIEVQTRTLHRMFLLRVVERAADATPRLVVPPQASAECAAECAEMIPAAPDASPAPAEPPATAALSARGPEPEHAPAAPVSPPAAPVPEAVIAPDVEPATARAAAAARSQRFELSVHALAGLGTTALHVPGYQATYARQPHRTFGMRFVGWRPGSWWGMEANVSGEWLIAPTVHRRMNDTTELHLSGPWLRADAGLRMRYEASLAPTAYAGIGFQVHLRDIETFKTDRYERSEDMPFSGVLALGLGLEYQAGNLLLGLDLHVRQGVPADYRSVAALLSVGYFLDRGE